MRGAEARDNAVATAHLIQAYRMHAPELCLGMYEGQREVSVKLSGFESQEHAQRIARTIIASFGQECVLMVLESGAMMAVTEHDGSWLGGSVREVADPVKGGIASYTMFMDGTVMYSKTHDALYALAA
jgi:hypothetical protein